MYIYVCTLGAHFLKIFSAILKGYTPFKALQNIRGITMLCNTSSSLSYSQKFVPLTSPHPSCPFPLVSPYCCH